MRMPLLEPNPSKPSRVYRPRSGGGISAPVNITPPEISGTGGELVGTEITVTSPGTWTNSPTSYTYQWRRGELTNIEAATASSYTLTAADMNESITCVVVAYNAEGRSDDGVSAAFTPAAATLSNTGAPSASDDNGGAAPANLFTSDGSWLSNPPNPTFSYAWTGGALGSPTSATTSAADPGNYTCEVTANNGYSSPFSANSNTVTLS